MYWQYIKYVVRHKWYVFIECCRVGIPLRGLLHDMSKLLPGEFIPYARYFYGKQDLTEQEGIAEQRHFDLAWLHHQKRNKHHWQWWVLPEDDGGVKVLPMPEVFRKEMLCDWKGAGKAQGYKEPGECAKWYRANKGNMQLHPDTRSWIESELSLCIIPDGRLAFEEND